MPDESQASPKLSAADAAPEALRLALAGRYDLTRRLGSGGMADVYLAEDRRHRRPVAVKVLRAGVGDWLGAERFLREIETAARLQHPNILPVYDSGELGGALFYVMPFVEGGSLRERLRAEAPFAWRRVLPILREVGDALGFAHARNVVHRDIKPENILFLADHAVVADFGIARAIIDAGGDRLTEAGLGLGTPEYMSPEQAFGEVTIDARSDVYSLACVLFELLAGTPPYTAAAPFGVLLKKSRDPVPALTRRDLPAAVEPALRRALHVDPAHRFDSVEEMLDAMMQEAPAVVTGSHRAAASLPAVAVLPFSTLGGTTDDAYWGDGISEELIDGLAAVDGLRVVARTSSFAFRETTSDVRTIGRALGVASLVEGSVRRAGSRMRITARLVDAESGMERWTQRFERESADIFAVQDEIARAIVQALRGQLVPASTTLVATATVNPAAYEQFLEARFHWNRRTESSLRHAVDCLQRALGLDASFVQAREVLAQVLVTLGVYGAALPVTAMSEARALADGVLALRANSVDALSARAAVRALFDWDWAAAERDFLAALSAADATPAARQWYATNLLIPTGRFGEAQAQLAMARERDPLSPVIAISVGIAQFYARELPAATATFRALVAADPQFGMAHLFLGRALVEAGDVSGARVALAESVRLLGGSNESIAAEGVAAARAGDGNAAYAVLAELTRRAGSRFVSPVLRAQLHAGLDDPDAAIAALEEARLVRATDLVWIGVRPVFDGLRGDARFQRLLVDTGLAAQRD